MALKPSSQTKIKNPKNNLNSNALPEKAVELLTSFYEDASTLRTMPGKKDVLSVQFNDNEKKKKASSGWHQQHSQNIRKIVARSRNRKVKVFKIASKRSHQCKINRKKYANTSTRKYGRATLWVTFHASKTYSVISKLLVLLTVFGMSQFEIYLIRNVCSVGASRVQQITFISFLSYLKSFLMGR